jgi:uncharacterized protein with HEPN domain
MTRDFLVYIDDILNAMDRAEIFVAEMSYEQFENDPQIKPQIQQILRDYQA